VTSVVISYTGEALEVDSNSSKASGIFWFC
jgi:hypothetical protein